MSAEIVGIQISPVPMNTEKPKGGFAVLSLSSAELVADHGIRSLDGLADRYYGALGETLRGAYPNNKIRQLTLITKDAIDRANKDRGIPFTWEETRRNIIIQDMEAEELNSLINKLISLGAAEVKGTELCDPCDRPDKLSGKKGFKSAFTNKDGVSIGGLRVEIKKGEIVRVGERVGASK